MWISKEEYNRLTQNCELGAKTAMKLAEILTKLNETQFELLQTKQELNDAKDYANHLKASRDEIIKGNHAKIKELIAARDEFEKQAVAMRGECDERFADYYRAKEELDHVKDEYNELDIKYQGLLTANKAARAVIEGLTEKNAAIERELENYKAAYESEHAEANEWFYQYTVSEENRKRAKEKNEELAKEASELARELTHAEVDLALYKKAFDDIAHAFGDEFRYLNTRIAMSESEIDRNELSRAVWAMSGLWFDVHDVMTNAGWRVDEDGNT